MLKSISGSRSGGEHLNHWDDGNDEARSEAALYEWEWYHEITKSGQSRVTEATLIMGSWLGATRRWFRGLLENESLKFCLRKITVYYVPQMSEFLNSQMDVWHI